MKIVLDGVYINNREELFHSLKVQMNKEEFLGNNLDALNDIISSMNLSIDFTVKNYELLESKLGTYMFGLYKVFNQNNIEVVKIK